LSEHIDIPFEEWITSVFGSGSDEMDPWDLEPEVTIAYLTNLFENAARVLQPFSDTQIKEGLWYLANESSDPMYELLNLDVSWAERKRCISSIFTLFEHFFAQRCSPHLSHLDTLQTDTSNVSPLNLICYMWWDIFPTWGKPGDPAYKEIDEALLDTMRRSLALSSDACRESALHGLGHWHLHYPTQVEGIIDQFLESSPHLRVELKAYAQAARAGRVQ
jgi:hypothetical protein